MNGPLRLAMWSGPRNISTALLRSWGSRADTYVCDEPFYAHYLKERPAVDHPGRDEVIRSQENDWRKVAAWLTGEIPAGKDIFYQKHMAHHLLPGMEGDWLSRLTHAFLIRDPREMLTSLAQVMTNPTVEDTGLPQQWEIYRRLQAEGGVPPPVIDARDVLEDPRGLLTRLCEAVGVPFDAAMLRWEAGPRATDGVWAKYWYAAVERSTGFAPYRPKPDPVPERLRDVHAVCEDFYRRLHRHRLTA